MRTLIHHAMAGSYDDDDYYYLVFDENEASIYVEYSWHYWRPSGIDKGSRNLSLIEVKKELPGIYRAVVELLKTKLFPQS